MKHLFFIPSMLMVLFANAININDSKITDVTVFRNYAKETRMASAQIPEGNSEIIISNVSTYLDENSLPIEPPSSIKDSGYWFGQFDFVLSNADLYIRRSKEIEDKFKGTPDYIQSFKSRAFENLDKICNDEYDFKTNYENNI